MIRLHADAPIIFGDSTLILITRISITAHSAGAKCWLQACKEPYALVIRDTHGLRAMDMTGQRLETDRV